MIAAAAAFTAAIFYFSPERTEKSENRNRLGIYINEVCSSYFPTSFEETQPASDWIELYNASGQRVNLGKLYLSDDKENLYKCRLPEIDLMPGEYYIIHSDSDEMTEKGIGIDFRISAKGEVLYLSDDIGVIDIVDIPAMDTNTSWSRLPDAGTEWENTELTYQISNNKASSVVKKIKKPIFMVQSGFYPAEFELEIKSESKTQIYYTLDGSDPGEKGILYEAPILIRDTSNEPNHYAGREDFNLLSEGQAVEPVEKITVVRAIAIDSEGRKSDIVTQSYMVGKENNKIYSEMYTVSLVTDPYNLFDYNEGIYILGRGFDEFVAAGGDLDDIIQVGANYRIDGKKSERPASIEIFNESRESILKREVGIRIHGATTRGCAQKSFSVYARDMYDGKETIDDLFGKNTSVHKFFLYTNREGTKLRDKFISEALSDRNVATQKFIYCNVFLDGEYWGEYLLAEVYDEYFFENHYGIEKDNIEIWEDTMPPDVSAYLESVDDMSKDEVYGELGNMIDIQSFIDYYASMLYLNNTDWLSYNGRCYRSLNPGPGKNEDGKWRWGVWDSESTMYDAELNTFHTGNVMSWEDDTLAQVLMQHEEFRKQFVITYMDLYNNIWREDCALKCLSKLKNDTQESYRMHYQRFFQGNDIDEYTNKLITFFKDRAEYALEDLKKELPV